MVFSKDLKIASIAWEFTRFSDIDYFEIEIYLEQFIKNSPFEEIVQNKFKVQLNHFYDSFNSC